VGDAAVYVSFAYMVHEPAIISMRSCKGTHFEKRKRLSVKIQFLKLRR